MSIESQESIRAISKFVIFGLVLSSCVWRGKTGSFQKYYFPWMKSHTWTWAVLMFFTYYFWIFLWVAAMIGRLIYPPNPNPPPNPPPNARVVQLVPATYVGPTNEGWLEHGDKGTATEFSNGAWGFTKAGCATLNIIDSRHVDLYDNR